jgi:type III secretory pathway component EscS
MDPNFYQLVEQAWRVLLLVLVPSLAIPAAGAAVSFLLGFIGIRDDGVAYAVRLIAMVAVGAMTIQSCVDGFVELMNAGLS